MISRYTRRVTEEQKVVARDTSLDILRGIAVFLMILAHAVIFFHDRSNSVLMFFSDLGDTLAFTTFLFISGASSYIIASSKSGNKYDRREKALRRAFNLLLGYYFLAFVISFGEINKSLSPYLIRDIYKILFFVKVPIYTEFMIPFIFFAFITALFPRLISTIGRRLWLCLIIGIGGYLIGYYLYPAFVDESFVYIKAIFVGNTDLTRFPILFYLPVFLLGLVWGNIILTSKDAEEKRSMASFFAIAFTVFMIYIIIVSPIAHIGYLETYERWPPSSGFLSRGMAFVFISIFILSLRKSQEVTSMFGKIFMFLGKYAFSFYIVHITLLILYRNSLDKLSSSPVVVIGLTCLLFTLTAIISIVFSYIKRGLTKSTENSSHIIQILWGPFVNPDDSRLIKKRYFLVALILLLALTSNVGDKEELIETDTTRSESIKWWDLQYNSFKQITIKNNNPLTSINKGDAVYFRIDHKKLVDDKKSLFNGDDMRLVYLEDGQYKELDFELKTPQSRDTELTFIIQKNIWAGQFDENYFLYYDNNMSKSGSSLETKSLKYPKSFQIIIGAEQSADISIATSQLWVLKGEEFSDLKKNMIVTATSKTTKLNNTSKLKYVIEGTEIAGDMKYINTSTKKDQWNATIDVRNLPVGEYRVKVMAEGVASLESPSRGFYVSEPLYLAFTMDWEGLGMEDKLYGSMSGLSARHDNLPITHFFNPRIYVTSEVSRDDAQKMTEWVKQRQKEHGDQIAYHLHMQFDFVQAAGVTPRTSPAWDANRTGYSVSSVAYTKDEIKKIINFGLQQFELNGFEKPTVYRAGGWQADQDLLASLDELDFTADSSGRESANIGAVKIPWNLQSTSRPYQISKSDQNTSTEGNNYNLWELPNNGGNTFQHDEKILQERFNDNYDGNGPLKERQILTFLSHPHWFESGEELRIDRLLTYTDQFLYSQDRGPVVYTTLDNAMKAWGITE